MVRNLCMGSLFLLPFLILAPVGPAHGRDPIGDLPEPARMTLSKMAPFFEKKEYRRALEILKAFQNEDRPPADPGAPDPADRRHPEIYFAIGNCHLLLEHPEAAAEAYRLAVARDPNHAFAWLNLAKASYELKKYGDAGHAFAKGYESTQDKNPEHLYFSAAAYLMAADYRRSIDVFERLFSAHPSAVKSEWIEHLVNALLSSDQSRQAIPHIRDLTRRYTGDKQVRWQELLLHQYIHLNMTAEADALVLALIRTAPTAPIWWKALVHIRLNAGRNTDALAALMIYAYLSPLTTEETKLLADLQFQTGIPLKAAETYRLLASKGDDRQTGQAWLMAGHAALMTGDTAAGREAFQKAAGFSAQKKAAETALHQLTETTGS